MADRIFDAFLRRQYEDAMALSSASDLVEIIPIDAAGTGVPDRYLLHLRCTGLVRDASGAPTEADRFVVGIWFPPDYLARVEPGVLVTWLEPSSIFHPNIRVPFVCLGRITPGTPLVDLAYQIFELITYTKVTMREDDALNRDACSWARQHVARFPLDRRPLKRRRTPQVDTTATGTEAQR